MKHSLDKKRILVIQLAKLGDFIQSTALLKCIKEKWPNHEISLVTAEAAVLEAATICGLAHQIILETDFHKLINQKNEFDAVFVLNSHPKAANLADQIKSKAHYGPFLHQEQLCFPSQQRLIMSLMSDRRLGRLNLVDLWRTHLKKSTPRLCFWPQEHNERQEKKIGLQLGCRNHLRRWPVEYFAAMIRELKQIESGLQFVLFGGAPERALGARLKSFFKDDSIFIDMIGKTDLAALGRELGKISLLVSADTGVMHLAAAIKTKVLAVFSGPAFGPETGPYGHGHIIYQSLPDCAPCREGGSCHLRSCKLLPDAHIAARLAAESLGLTAAYELKLATGHRVWKTFLDHFGQSLKPMGNAVLDDKELAALAINEALRSIIKADYQTDEKIIGEILKSYTNINLGDTGNLSTIVPQSALKDMSFRTAFEASLSLLTKLIG